MKLFKVSKYALGSLLSMSAVSVVAKEKHDEFKTGYEPCMNYKLKIQGSEEKIVQLCREVSVEEQVVALHAQEEREQERRLNRSMMRGRW